MTVDAMRAALGLGPEVADAEVVRLYAEQLGAGVPAVSIAEIATPAALKEQLRLEPGPGAEDALLARLLATALSGCTRHLERALDDATLDDADRETIAQAAIVWAAAMYEDRTGDGDAPRATVSLLRPLRNMAR